MRHLWRIVDAQANWLRHTFGPTNQLRLGVLMVWLGLAYLCWWVFSGEPFGIYSMSAIALVFGGLGVVVTAETLIEVAPDEEAGTDA
jgi:hypothetical protein